MRSTAFDDANGNRFAFPKFIAGNLRSARAAERCPPPVSDEMIRIFGVFGAFKE